MSSPRLVRAALAVALVVLASGSRSCMFSWNRIRMTGLRWLLVLLLLNGLAPGIAEAAEVAVHFVRTGHVAHAVPGENDLGDQGPEHSCGVVFHHCGCCAVMRVVPLDRSDDIRESPPIEKEHAHLSVARTADRSLEPPFRPPIV